MKQAKEDRQERVSPKIESKQTRETVNFLVEASTMLATAPNYQAKLDSLARFAVTYLADVCVIDMVNEAGEIHRVAIAHIDQEKEALIQKVMHHYPLSWHRSHPTVEALKTGQLVSVTNLSNPLLVSAVCDSKYLEIIRSLGCQSSLTIPLIVRGKGMGAISFLKTKSAYTFSLADLNLAKELANLAALSLARSRIIEQKNAKPVVS